jgi:hypothetical protein
MSTTGPADGAPDEGVEDCFYVPSINHRTGREFTIDEQRDKQELYSKEVREIMQKALNDRIRQREERIAAERLLTRDQVIVTRSIQEEQYRRLRVENDAMETKLMLELQADSSVNIHGYSVEGCESLSNMAKSMLSMVKPGDSDDFIRAVKAMHAAEVKAFKRADSERRSVLRGKEECGHCGKHGVLHKCAGCHSDSPARYCNQNCQRAGWKAGHKEECLRKKKPEGESAQFGGIFPKDG